MRGTGTDDEKERIENWIFEVLARWERPTRLKRQRLYKAVMKGCASLGRMLCIGRGVSLLRRFLLAIPATVGVLLMEAFPLWVASPVGPYTGCASLLLRGYAHPFLTLVIFNIVHYVFPRLSQVLNQGVLKGYYVYTENRLNSTILQFHASDLASRPWPCSPTLSHLGEHHWHLHKIRSMSQAE